MKISTGACVFAVVIVIISVVGYVLYTAGHEDGYELGKAEQKIEDNLRIKNMQDTYDSLLYPIPELKTEDEYSLEIIKSILDSVNSIDVDVQINKSGNNRGVITIYFGDTDKTSTD